ncbi:MAG: DUF1501 domain-containing protein [Planctomycetaceae bacterium]|nr:DUF1501 domain-containing protein [Planctomycetaceae bacterium]
MSRLLDGFELSRRRWLQAGGLGMLGLGLSDLARLRSTAALNAAQDKGRRRSCVFLFLFGGPSHIDLWDMKPDAPEIVRGEFRPIDTNVPGIQVCEHLPRFSRVMDKVCLLRSTTHRMNVHGPACSEVFTGREYFGPPTTDQATREDWPSLSSLMARFGQGAAGMPPSVVLPWYLQFPGQSKRIAGQTGGRMGEQHNAFLLQGEVERADFEMEGLRVTDDVPMNRIDRRRNLLGRIGKRDTRLANVSTATFDGHTQSAFDLLANRVGETFDLRRESAETRERYGATAAGQSLLLARRLVEAGVGLVTVNWQDETKTDGVNTCWDTHQGNFPKLQNLLCPIFDRAFPAFLQDLDERGLLETTLVVALGEFGRTPKMGQFSQSANTQKTGRDHWPHAFTTLLAGGGVRGGQIYGATTRDGGYVQDNPVTPADLTATILHHLGVDFTREYDDEFQHLKRRLSEGRVVSDLG